MFQRADFASSFTILQYLGDSSQIYQCWREGDTIVTHEMVIVDICYRKKSLLWWVGGKMMEKGMEGEWIGRGDNF